MVIKMGNVDTDTKLRLIQDIRQQTQYNRIKCREREHFLYGSSLELPKGELYGTENASLKETANNAAFPQGSKGKMSSFRIRLMLSVILFGAFIFGITAVQKYTMCPQSICMKG